MFTKTVTVSTTATDLKTLMETAGRVFPNDNDTCQGLIVQIDPEASGTVDVMSVDEPEGITLSIDAAVGPPSISYRDSRVRNTYLVATEDTSVKVMVEQQGG